ncbi:MAG TPA: TVP38/TMEM64 family protein [Gemmatimonadaceae bacterium]|nr:TVP38/TMEM64 family protein [Gemmatimonadaceae bacterium]
MQRARAGPRKIPSTRAALVRIGALVLVLAVASLVGYELGWFDYRHTFQHVARIRRSHTFVEFVIGFVLIYGLGTSLGVPGLPFTVVSGALFGTTLGSALSWCGALIGAAGGYWIARTVGHKVVTRWLERFKRVDAAVEQARDFTGMLRLRLIPVFPLGIMNFIGGLARAPFGSYLAATAIGVIPSTVIYTYFADSLLEGVGSGRREALQSLIIATVLLIIASLAPRMFDRYRARASAASD